VFDRHGESTRRWILSGGQFTLLTGSAAKPGQRLQPKVAKADGHRSVAHVIGPRRDIVDHHGDWARARESEKAGACWCGRTSTSAWRAEELSENPRSRTDRVLAAILHRDAAAARQAAQ
jgi:2,4-dichlorophenol 6-monooxygenase